jgi:predicted signal transduction protein with EAL and GGDEF domain
MIEESGSPPRIFAEDEMRLLLAREVQRCTRYQDFLTICLVRSASPGAAPADLEAAVAPRIAAMLRATDFVGRIGADVAVFLVHTPETDAALITERIRERLSSDFRIGVASFPTNATSEEGLLAHAEAQLEAARPR